MRQAQRTDRAPSATPTFQESPIMAEGLLKLRDLPAYEKLAYFTLNSIPLKYAFPIAFELTKTLLRAGFSRTKKADHLDLRPNYAGLHFTPLEMSFARRPEGTLNFLKDMISLKPYRLLSEVRDGYLYSPNGGELHRIFPGTISAMLDDPLTLAILRLDRLEHLSRCAREYDDISGLDGMPDGKLFSLLTHIGRQNTNLSYLFGFRDSLVKAADFLMDNALGSGWTEGRLRGLATDRMHENMARMMPKRGPEGIGKWEPDSGYLDATYELRELPDAVHGDLWGTYAALKAKTRERLERIFRIREELAQESALTLGSIEYCRGAFYEAANEVGMRYLGRGGLKEAGDIEFLTIYEVSDLVKGRKIDAHAASRRKRKWEGHDRPRE